MDHRMKENRLRGSAAYPVVLYQMPHMGVPLHAALHWQDDVEVLRLNRGAMEMTLDGEKMLLHPGDMVFINPGQLHGFQALDPKSQWDIFIFPWDHLLFANEDHDQQAFLRPLAEGLMNLPARIDAEEQQWMEQVFSLQKTVAPGKEMLTKALLLIFTARLFRKGRLLPSFAASREDTCKQILAYIQAHFGEKLTVSRIARAVGLSPTYFSAFFLRHFCQHFSAYLLHYRLEQAEALLMSTSSSVSDIALQTGFSSASHLIALFKREKGITPMAFRKTHAP